jgi:hypothetical protein
LSTTPIHSASSPSAIRSAKAAAAFADAHGKIQRATAAAIGRTMRSVVSIGF